MAERLSFNFMLTYFHFRFFIFIFIYFIFIQPSETALAEDHMFSGELPDKSDELKNVRKWNMSPCEYNSNNPVSIPLFNAIQFFLLHAVFISDSSGYTVHCSY
jgi:hypothetical protein